MKGWLAAAAPHRRSKVSCMYCGFCDFVAFSAKTRAASSARGIDCITLIGWLLHVATPQRFAARSAAADTAPVSFAGRRPLAGAPVAQRMA